MRNIRWTKSAVEDLRNTEAYLEERFSQTVVIRSRDHLFRTLDTISGNPEIGRKTKGHTDLRYFVVSKFQTVICRYDEQAVFILQVFDNRRDPQRKMT